MSPSTPRSDFLAGAVDLSQLAQTRQAPARPPTRPAAGGGAPNEFRVSIVGDADGAPKVLLAFGHMQWVFDPELAEDLGSVLVGAASQAGTMPATTVEPGGAESDSPVAQQRETP